LSFAAFNLGLALLALGRDEEAMTAYRRAGEQFPEAIDEDGMSDLNEARKTWLSEERARAVIDLLAQFKKKPK
jgi:tetratricopeptide (TPR) repeat protein